MNLNEKMKSKKKEEIKRFHDLLDHFERKFFNDFFIRASNKFATKHFNNKEIIVVEIGTHLGYNALNMLKTLNAKHLYIIDPYEKYLDGDGATRGMDNNYEKAKRRLKGYPVTFIKKYSNNAVDDIPNADFIYIDGNHTYEHCKADIENYYPKVKGGGILAGHDFNGRFFGVIKAIMEFKEKNNLEIFSGGNTYTGYDWWFVK